MHGSLIEQTLRDELIQTFKDPGYRPPPLPNAALQLLGLTDKNDADIQDVVRLLERDPMLAGTVMRLVSSPIYARGMPVKSLTQAVLRLGLQTLRDIVFEAALNRGFFNCPHYKDATEQIRRHSTTTAYITPVVCEHAKIEAGNAFICGLLHDIGFAALLVSVPNTDGDLSPKLEDVWPDLDKMHERASALIAHLWLLPPDICEVVGHHHHLIAGGSAKIAAAVCLADALTERFGANIVGPLDAQRPLIATDRVAESNVASARALLEISDETMQRIVEAADRIVPEILWV